MRKSVWVLLLIVTLLLSACGPAMQPAAGPETESGEVFMVALPRLVIDFDDVGNPSIMGFGLADLARYGMYVPNYQLSKAYVDMLKGYNVQHVELRQTGNGIVLFFNGKPLPHIGWSDESLQQVGDLASLFNVQNTQVVRKFLPVVRRLGLDLVLRFPPADGSSEIPLIDPEEAVAVMASPAGEPASAVVAFEVKYDANGVPAILGISAADLAALGISAPLALHPYYIQMLQQYNIQTMELRGKADGIFLYVNGTPLPNIVWDDAMLGNATDAFLQFNPGLPTQYVEIAKTVVPLVNNADIAIMVHFPLADGAQPIAAKMHW